MTARPAVVRLLVAGTLGSWLVGGAGWAQQQQGVKQPARAAAKPSAGAQLAEGIAGGIYSQLGYAAKPPAGAPLAETEPDFMVWRQKAQLELEILQAQVEAKRAEIQLREAEHRVQRLAPDLAIIARLDEPVAMSFANETPLEDVLKYIRSATAGPGGKGIPIYVDPAGLMKAEKTMTSPVVLDLEGVPLRTTLRLILKQLGLVYEVRDGLLTITAGRGD